ncbi:MAG: SDR family oxidoreductase [Methylobacteriaceae bacterium]|nr:SDR family oxidoreductase [Methylobacteriaceae bacterium]
MPQQTQSVIVTGAAGGMGAAVVRQLAARGVNVVAVDVVADKLDRLKRELKEAPGEVDPVVADVGSAREVEAFVARAVQRFGGLDGIFNIAAILGEFKPIADSSNDGFDEVMRINTKSVWLGMKYAIPALIKRGGGAIVNTGSYLAWHGCELLGPYNASKHALVALTKTAALECGRYNIRVNIICPGSMNTPMNDATADGFNPGDRAAGLKALAANTVTGRVTDPEEVATVGVFLLLDAPIQMTGALVPVDGGYSAK